MPPKKMPWFRFYVEALADPKLRRLKPDHRWLWVAVLAAARQSPTPGLLMVTDQEPYADADLADLANLSERAVAAGMEAFARSGMVRRHHDPDCWAVCKWDVRQHQSDSSAERVARHRARQQPGEGPPIGRYNGVSVTPFLTCERVTEAETDTELPSKQLTNIDLVARAVGGLALDEVDRRIAAGLTLTGSRQAYAKPIAADITQAHSSRLHELAAADPGLDAQALAAALGPIANGTTWADRMLGATTTNGSPPPPAVNPAELYDAPRQRLLARQAAEAQAQPAPNSLTVDQARAEARALLTTAVDETSIADGSSTQEEQA